MLSFIIAALVGVVVGIFSGMLGIGGGTLMVPIFRLGYGFEAVVATGTSLFAIIPTSISGVITHLRNKTCDWKIGVAAGVGGACTSWLGVVLAEHSPSWAVMLVAALIIAWSAYTMFKKAFKKKEAVPPEVEKAQMEAAMAHVSTKNDWVKAFLIGLVAGVASGYVGVGGGFLMVPMFMSLLHLPMKKCSGTSLIGVMILAIPGVIMQWHYGNIEFLVGIALAIGAIPGAVVGGNLVKRIPEKQLRILFGCFLLFGAVMLVVKEFI